MKIIQIKDSKDQKKIDLFLEVASNVYKNDPTWAPSSEKIFLQRLKAYELNEDITITLTVMIDNDTAIARSVIIFKEGLMNAEGLKQGWICFFEIYKNHRKHAATLLKYSEDLLKEKGAEVAIIPRFDNSILGLQTTRFDLPQTFLSTHNPPFYQEIFFDAGYETIKTFYTFYYTRDNIPNISLKFPKIRTRTIENDNFEEEVRSFHEIKSQSFKQSLGYIPRTFEEEYDMVKSMLPYLDNELIIIAENQKNEPIGFLTCIPDIYQIMSGEEVTRARLISIAVLSRYRKKRIGAAMCSHLMKNIIKKKNYQYLETSSIRESNITPLRLIKMFGAQKGKEYIILQKKL